MKKHFFENLQVFEQEPWLEYLLSVGQTKISLFV